MRKIKIMVAILILLFSLPLALKYVPQPNPTHSEPQLVFASQEVNAPKDVLLFFTHSHEAYIPIVKAQRGKSLYYDQQHNIEQLSQPFETFLGQQQITVHTIETDVMQTMKLTHSKFHEAYAVARPFVQEAIAKKPYDLILDIHRDSAKKKTTTLQVEGKSFAKIALVVGLEHPMHGWNLAYAEQLHAEVERIVPGLSRGVLKKKGKGVDGIYNQDLAEQMLLIEIGGIDNTEQELLHTIEVLSQAIAAILQGPKMTTTAL